MATIHTIDHAVQHVIMVPASMPNPGLHMTCCTTFMYCLCCGATCGVLQVQQGQTPPRGHPRDYKVPLQGLLASGIQKTGRQPQDKPQGETFRQAGRRVLAHDEAAAVRAAACPLHCIACVTCLQASQALGYCHGVISQSRSFMTEELGGQQCCVTSYSLAAVATACCAKFSRLNTLM